MVVLSSWDNSKEEKNRIELVISMIKKRGNLGYGILYTWLCDISYVASNSKLFWVIWLEVAVGDIFNEFMLMPKNCQLHLTPKKIPKNMSSKKLLKLKVCLYVINYTRHHVFF